MLSRPSLITIYKAFIRPYLDYGDVALDQAFNNSFLQRLESTLYDATLAITRGIRGTYKEKLYQEFGFESLQSRKWFGKLSIFYKITKNKSPSYLYYLIPKPPKLHFVLVTLKIYLPLKLITISLKKRFFSSTIIKCNKLIAAVLLINLSKRE